MVVIGVALVLVGRCQFEGDVRLFLWLTISVILAESKYMAPVAPVVAPTLLIGLKQALTFSGVGRVSLHTFHLYSREFLSS